MEPLPSRNMIIFLETRRMINMGQYEIIDRLCEVVTLMAEIIQKQAETIEQSQIDADVKKDLEKMRKNADEKITAVGRGLQKTR